MGKLPKSLDIILAIAVTFLLYNFTNPLYGTLFLLLFFISKLYLNRFRVFAVMGKSQFDKGNTDKAIELFEKAIALPNCSGGIKSSYAFLLFTNDKIDEAYKIISNTTVTEPREVMSFIITKACITWKKGLHNDAIELLEKAHADGKSAGVYEFLGYYYALNRDLDKALPYNLEALEYDKDNQIIRDNLARTYFELNNYEEALKIYEPLLENNPKFLDPYYYASKIYISKGEKEKALSLLDRTSDIKDNFMTTLKQKDVQKLRDELNESNEIPSLPNHEEIASDEESDK